jgi:DNA modification methylase
MTWSVEKADAIEFLQSLPASSVDLIFSSPPYEQARLYLENGEDLGIARDTEAWVAWMVQIYTAAQRCCKGLVAFVVAGQTKKFRWSAGPALLMADLARAGFNLRNPPIYHRVGIPGSGGPDWLRSDYEWIVCTARPGKLPWSDNTAAGHIPKWGPGGEMSHRQSNGTRRNEWGMSPGQKGTTSRKKNGKRDSAVRKSGEAVPIGRRITSGHKNGDTPNGDSYIPPTLANPGNVIRCNAGGGTMGNELCHENEAPFPEALADVFVQSFCPPGGLVCDPFAGSGTTLAVAVRHGRNAMGCDLRQSQVDLARRRIGQETPAALFGGAP